MRIVCSSARRQRKLCVIIIICAYYAEIAAKTWISLSKGTQLLLYKKNHARSKMRPFHVKIIVCRSLNLAVGRLLKMKKKKMELDDFRIAR